MGDFENAMKILKRFGEARTGVSIPDIEVIPTGIFDLDNYVLGVKGIPRGRILELSGEPNCGKSTLAEHIIASIQKMGGLAVYFNLEGTYDPKWGALAGIDNEKLILPPIKWGEDIFDQILSLLGVADIIVLDSLARLRSKDILIRTMNDGKKVAANAGMNEMGFGHIVTGTYNTSGKQLTPKISETKTILIVVNQIRDIIGAMYGPTQKTPGGWAHLHDYSIRLSMSKAKYEKDGEHHKQKIKVKCIKNKLAPPLRSCEFYLSEDNKLEQDEASIVLNLAITKDFIKKSGSWLKCDKFPDGKLQGLTKFAEWLEDNPDFVDLLK